MSKIEVFAEMGYYDESNKPVRVKLYLDTIAELLNTNKDSLLSLPFLDQVLHRIFANCYINPKFEDTAEMVINTNQFLADTHFQWHLKVNNQTIEPEQIRSGTACFVEGNKLNKNGNPKTFVAHTIVMSIEQWNDFMSAGEQIEREYPEEKDSYTRADGTRNSVIQRGQWLSRLSQSFLGGKQQRDVVTEIQNILSQSEYDETADIDTFPYALEFEIANAQKMTPEQIENRVRAIENDDRLPQMVAELEKIRSDKARESLGL